VHSTVSYLTHYLTLLMDYTRVKDVLFRRSKSNNSEQNSDYTRDLSAHYSALVYIANMYMQMFIFALCWMFYVESSITQSPGII